ncbi:10869_t:CDS:2, partial [Ambispora leptoticha]
WTDKLLIAKEIVLGLLFLHENNIIHRDLHLKNILIHRKQPKIADFSLSKQINETSMTSNSTIYRMLAYVEPHERPPFQTFESKMELCFHIYQGNREESIEETPLQYIEIYKQCWDCDPANYPETKEVFDTFKQFVDNDLQQQKPSDNPISNESSIKNNKPFSLNQDITSLQIMTSAPLYLPDSTSSSYSSLSNANTLTQDCNIENMRKEAHKSFNQGKFLKALELYEEILNNSQHTPNNKDSASFWDLSSK